MHKHFHEVHVMSPTKFEYGYRKYKEEQLKNIAQLPASPQQLYYSDSD